jgi:regulator of protease activity HflC (stomatin/prohibitin superfamily)
MQKSPKSPQTKLVTVAIVTVICLLILSCVSSLGRFTSAVWMAGEITIATDERGVVISSLVSDGYRPAILEPGSHRVIPFFERVVIYSTKPQTYTFSSQRRSDSIQSEPAVKLQTRDGKTVEVDTRVDYSINPAEVIQLHAAWQGQYSTEFVAPAMRQAIGLVVSQYQLSELVVISKSEIEQAVSDILAPKFNDNHLLFHGCTVFDIRTSEK